MEKLTSEDKIVIATMFVSMLGGVASAIYGLQPVIIAVFFAMFVATAIYRFLGGVEGAMFSSGPFRLGGTAAVFVVVAWGVDSRLVEQATVEPSKETWIALDKEKGVPIDLTINGATKIEAPRENSMSQKQWRVVLDQRGLRLISLDSTSFEIGYVQYEMLEQYQLFNTLGDPGTFRITDRLYAGTQNIRLSPYEYVLHVGGFDDGLAEFSIVKNEANEVVDQWSLRNKTARIIRVEERHFLIAIVASDQTGVRDKPWVQFGFVELLTDLDPNQTRKED